ncbi:uncharacterized protein DEA37_0000736 [Paragonimus westermani]|uniref:Translation elongation factor EF1B beta/delta subunit guanine nucleotide exchange domain-containing protein n=1 Tax=Paragonimus westermani TaxID=34504 RepID=A0A5J4NU08_9TREM|nr:uncharacterized protein DEA37_0000736 [Paragonimus westermani]
MDVGLLCEADACAHFPDYPGLERDYVAYLSEANRTPSMNIQKMSSYLTQEIQKAREHIKSSLDKEDPDAEKMRAQRLAEYEAKKSKKPAETAKSNIILDVKPWGDDTDLKEMENLVRNIKADGLYWGQSKFVPLAYGIKKLQICCVVEDDKVGTDFLEEAITGLEDHVQSVDIVAFNKV